jgi:NAD+-dependent farnesol dehydrogenase
MKIFITGATGYIGQQVALFLANQGHTLHALVRSQQKTTLLQHPNINFFSGDVGQPQALSNAAQGCDVCIHAAAFSALYTRNKNLFEEINITGTKLVFEAARTNGIKKFILLSSAGIFGPSNGKPINEDTQRTLPYFNEYERTKAVAEKWVLEQNSTNMPVVALNLTRVYGPGQLTEANAGTRLIEQVMNKGWRIIPGNGKSIGNYIYIDDIPVACQKAIEHGKGGNRYIIGGENLSFNQYFDYVKTATNAKQTMVHLPVSIIMAIAYVMQWLAFIGITPTITPPWARRYMYNWVLDTQKAANELGYTPTQFMVGVQKTVSWLKQQNKTQPAVVKETIVETVKITGEERR